MSDVSGNKIDNQNTPIPQEVLPLTPEQLQQESLDYIWEVINGNYSNPETLNQGIEYYKKRLKNVPADMLPVIRQKMTAPIIIEKDGVKIKKDPPIVVQVSRLAESTSKKSY